MIFFFWRLIAHTFALGMTQLSNILITDNLFWSPIIIIVISNEQKFELWIKIWNCMENFFWPLEIQCCHDLKNLLLMLKIIVFLVNSLIRFTEFTAGLANNLWFSHIILFFFELLVHCHGWSFRTYCCSWSHRICPLFCGPSKMAAIWKWNARKRFYRHRWNSMVAWSNCHRYIIKIKLL